jgi:hypothetical protein
MGHIQGRRQAQEDHSWYIIPRKEPHEFLPEHEDMTVVSFHTCAETELEEVACETGKVRVYGAAADGSSGRP